MRVELACRDKRCFLLRNIWTGSEIHPVNYLVGTEFISLGTSGQGHEADHSHLFNAEIFYLRTPIRLYELVLSQEREYFQQQGVY
jgi:hypothetical protein